MQREYRLKKRNDFRRVFRLGHSVANRQFVIYFKQKTGDKVHFRLGISVSRKVGNAVIRNRIRRRIKEIIRRWVTYIHPHLDVVIIARRPTAEMDYQQIESSLRHVMKRAQCFRSLPD